MGKDQRILPNGGWDAILTVLVANKIILRFSLLIFALCQGTRKTLRPVYTKNPNFHDMSVSLHSVIIRIYENYSRLVRIHFLHKAIEFDVWISLIVEIGV